MQPMDQITRVSNNLKLQLEHQIVKPQQSAAASKGFADVLKGELDKNDGVKFSKHAMERIQSRGVDMSQQTLDSLNRAVTKSQGLQRYRSHRRGKRFHRQCAEQYRHHDNECIRNERKYFYQYRQRCVIIKAGPETEACAPCVKDRREIYSKTCWYTERKYHNNG